jgi:hypothetical protein
VPAVTLDRAHEIVESAYTVGEDDSITSTMVCSCGETIEDVHETHIAVSLARNRSWHNHLCEHGL